MTHARSCSLFAALVFSAAAAAPAQMPSIPGLGGLGGLPNISNMGMGNAAGVLGYCTQNKLLGGSTDASSVANSLLKKPGVAGSEEFAAGQAGNILTGGKSSFSLGSVSDPIKSQACNMVLKQAGKFL